MTRIYGTQIKQMLVILWIFFLGGRELNHIFLSGFAFFHGNTDTTKLSPTRNEGKGYYEPKLY